MLGGRGAGCVGLEVRVVVYVAVGAWMVWPCRVGKSAGNTAVRRFDKRPLRKYTMDLF